MLLMVCSDLCDCVPLIMLSTSLPHPHHPPSPFLRISPYSAVLMDETLKAPVLHHKDQTVFQAQRSRFTVVFIFCAALAGLASGLALISASSVSAEPEMRRRKVYDFDYGGDVPPLSPHSRKEYNKINSSPPGSQRRRSSAGGYRGAPRRGKLTTTAPEDIVCTSFPEVF